jgi:long-chain fatty acid transport protein
MKNNNNKKFVFTLLTSVLFILPIGAHASGFQIFAENASQLGNAYAGAAAAVQDASTNYFNPAGLVNFDTRQVTYGTVFRSTHLNFSGQSTWQINPLIANPFIQTGSATSHQTNIIPSFNEAIPLTKNIALGLSVVMPFDFSSNYSRTSILQYVTTKSSIYVVDITPGIAYRIDPQWSVGIGADVERASLTNNYLIGVPVANVTLPPNNTQTENNSSAWAVSVHAGVLYQYDQNTRFGLTYHAPTSFNLHGESKLIGPLSQSVSAGSLISTGLNTGLKLPDYVEFSVDQYLGKKWQLLGSLDYVRWGLLNKMNFQNVQLVTPTAPVISQVTLPVKLNNTFRGAIGANYWVNQKLKLLTGLAYDQGASKTQSTLIFADNNSVALAAGASYKLNRAFTFDLAYSHIFNLGSENINTNNISGFQQANALGSFKRSENLVGFQIRWNIGYLGTVA